ncbi:hypothetical protein [Streptomyces anulatus]|uniref:hypothetical protein n=1 Tax=Streptomyces anulatus TaxID=1892 RepID=UPI003245C209|nr:hypothetical protein OH791_33820 [Streptomyces anulatus]
MSTPAPATPEGTTTDPGTQPATPPSPPAAPTPPEPAAPTTPTEPAEPTEPKGKSPEFKGDFDPAKFQKLVENLRGDVEAEKQKRQTAEQKAKDDQAAFMKKVAVAFGIETDEKKPPTPEELAKQLSEAQNETKAFRDAARQTQVELAVHRNAARLQADPEALLDSRAFEKALGYLDPSADDFTSAVEEAVKQALKANPKLAAKAPQPKEPAPAPAGGAPMDGAGNGKRQLGEADRKRMSPEEIDKATREGRFNAYLAGG